MLNLDPEEQRDMAIAAATRRHAAAMHTNAGIGHQQTLGTLAEDLAHRLSQSGVTEQLVRTSELCGDLMLGQMVRDLIQKSIDAEAEIAATKEIEQLEAGVTSKDRQHMGAMQVQREISAAYGSAVSV